MFKLDSNPTPYHGNVSSTSSLDALRDAAAGGNIREVEKILAKVNLTSPASNFYDHYLSEALGAAVVCGHHKMVKWLLVAGAEVNATGDFGTALQVAAGTGHLNIVEMLLAAGAEVNATGGFGTALQAAVRYGHLDIVRMLLEAGADVNTTDSLEKTALQAAAEAGHLDIMITLLAAGADVNATNYYEGTALEAAARVGHLDIVKILLGRGADVNVTGLFSPLEAAARAGHLEIVEILLAAGADVNATGYNGLTALQLAEQRGHLEVAKRLQVAKTNVNTPSDFLQENAPVDILPEPADKEDRDIKGRLFTRWLQIRHAKPLKTVWRWLNRPAVQSGYRRIEWQCVSLLTGGLHLSSYTKNVI